MLIYHSVTNHRVVKPGGPVSQLSRDFSRQPFIHLNSAPIQWVRKKKKMQRCPHLHWDWWDPALKSHSLRQTDPMSEIWKSMEILHQECMLYAFHIISYTCQECSEHIRIHSKYWPPSPILLLLHDSFELEISIKIAQWCSVCSKIGSWLNHGFPPIQFSNHSFNTHIVLRSLPFLQTIPRQRSEKSVW